LPLLIELRSYAGLCTEGNCTTFLEFLEYLGKTEGWALTQSALHNHLKNDGRAVVIFDGLDEIFDPEQRERITRQIVGFCGDYPKARVIVTSRVIGYRRKILTDAGFTHFTLQDLDEKQVETFVNRWYDLAMSDRPDEAKERRERILKSFKESASIRQLAGNPMLLTIMAIIGKHQELPRERWKLYDHAASVLIQHWDVNKHLQDVRIDADFIGEDDKKELLRRLAFRMQGGDGGLAGNYIHREQLQAEFEGYLRERYAQTPDRAKMIAEAMIQQFRERNFILSLYGANLYGFVHRAFLEYFCASAFVWKFEKTKGLTIEQLKTDVYGKHWEDRGWHEVLRLICGMVDEKWAGEIVDYLLSNKEEFPISPIAVASQCLDEVRNRLVIIDAVKHLVEEWVSLIDKALSIRIRSDLDIFLGKAGGELIGKAGNGLDEIYGIVLGFAKNENETRRALAPYALATGWTQNVETRRLVEELVIRNYLKNRILWHNSILGN
jgi:predicted NACHT family NTPase